MAGSNEVNLNESRMVVPLNMPVDGEEPYENLLDLERPVTSGVLPVIIFFHGGHL